MIDFQKKQALNHMNAFNKVVSNDFLLAYEKITDKTMLSIEVLYDLWRSVEYIEDNDIQGDIVEMGVWKGGSLGLVGYALEHKNSKRTVVGFDTFQGHPPPSNDEVDVWGNNMKERYDIEISNNGNWAKANYTNVYDFLGNIYNKNQYRLTKGKTQDRLKEIREIEKISILRLDMDWYEPTLLALNELYNKVSDRGVIIIDDYGHHSGAKDAFDHFFQEKRKTPLMHHINYSCISGIK